MSKPIITKQMLIDAKAFTEQVDLFEEIFGDSVVVTLKRSEKVAALFHWDLAIRLLDAQGRAEYQRAMTPARAEYQRVDVAALAEYMRATTPAWAGYKRAKAPLAEYRRATADAGAEYDRAAAAAWATAFIDMHKRGASK
jgi:hypothetical protein